MAVSGKEGQSFFYHELTLILVCWLTFLVAVPRNDGPDTDHWERAMAPYPNDHLLSPSALNFRCNFNVVLA